MTQSIAALEPVFRDLSDSVLHVYANDDLPVGPRIGVLDVPETTVKSLAGYEVLRRKLHRDRRWGLFLIVVAAVLAALFTWLRTRIG